MMLLAHRALCLIARYRSRDVPWVAAVFVGDDVTEKRCSIISSCRSAARTSGIRRLRPRSQRKSASAHPSVHCSLPLAEAGACQLLPSSLARRRKSVSARSLV